MTIGEKLQERRRKLGKSLKEVESELRIRPAYLSALENDDFEKLPGEAYVKAFLRSYSEYLGLDSNEIINDYKSTHTVTETKYNKFEFNFFSGFKAKLISSIIVLAIIAVAVWLAIPEREPTPQIPATPIETGTSTTQPETSNVQPPEETTEEPTKTAKKKEPFSLRFEITGNSASWIQVRVNDKYIFADTLQPDESYQTEVTQSAHVILGNPAVVTIHLNDKILADFPKNRISETTITSSGVELK